MFASFLQILSLFIILCSFIIIIYIPASLCQNGKQYETCGTPFQCAGIKELKYPYWGGSRPDYCGYPGFQLNNCQGDVPILNISSRQYRVMEIDNARKILKVAREDLWNTICPRFRYNTTLDQNLFTFSPNDSNINLHYGCSTSNGQPASQLPHMFECDVNSTKSASFFTAGEALPTGIRCDNKISVPVSQSAARNLALSTATTDLLQDALVGGFSLQWSNTNGVCENCLWSGGLCGTNLDSSFACYCVDRTYALTCNNTQTGKGSKKGLDDKLKYVIGLSLGVPSIIILFIVTVYYLKRQYSSGEDSQEHDRTVEAFLLNHGSLAPKRYNYLEIKNITKSFSEKLGQGAYGSVYKGMLPDGRLVAVKVLQEVNGNGEDFMNEVSSISRTSHVNIVNLLGFCYDGSRRALVYEFMPNKSLDKLICKSESPDTDRCLELKMLYKIAVGVAQGLEYLHEGCNTRIVHFDIKPQNILLDEDFCPKISDFGLAKLCRNKQSIVSVAGTRGTVGYIAPEVFCRNFGGMSYKSDVYSYGMMVLEIAGMRKIEARASQPSENYFPDRIYEVTVLSEKMKLDEYMTEEEETTRKMFLVGFWCIQTIPSDRPSMTKVLEMLKGSLESIEIPPKPYLFTSRLPVQDFQPSYSVNQGTEGRE